MPDDSAALVAEVARNTEAIQNLRGWEKTQNGSLGKMADRIDSLSEKFDSRFLAFEQRVNAQLKTTDERIQRRAETQLRWMIGLLGTIGIALLMLAIDMALRLA